MSLLNSQINNRSTKIMQSEYLENFDEQDIYYSSYFFLMRALQYADNENPLRQAISHARIEQQQQIKTLKLNESFIADTRDYEKICRLLEDKNGNTKIDVSLVRNKISDSIEYNSYPKTTTRAKVLSFDDTSVTAEIYYEDHETEGEFDEVFKDSLEEVGLLQCGTLFEIITERHKGGFSVDVAPVDDSLSQEDALLFEEIMKAKSYKC